MDDKLVERATKVKNDVATAKESFIAVKSEYEVNQKTLAATLAELKSKHNVDSYEDLQKVVTALAAKISGDLGKIEGLLKEASSEV